MTTAGQKEEVLTRDNGRMKIPPFTPAPVCDAIVRAAVAADIRRNDINLSVLQRRDLSATHPTMIELRQRKLILEQIDVEAVDFREAAKEMPVTELLKVLRENGIAARVGTAQQVVAAMPVCEHAVAVTMGIEAIKDKIEKSAPASCSVTDDRLGELDPPSAEALGKVAACAGR